MGVFTVGRQVALEIDMPGWWLANASVDMDFCNGRYYDSSTANPRAATDFLSCTRASVGYAKTNAGTLISFASNALRITDLGLLVEDARQNSFTQSEDFSHADWTKQNLTVTANQAVAPDSNTTMDKIVDTVTNDRHSVEYYVNSGVSGTLTVSFFVKDIDRRYVQILTGRTSTDFVYCYADLQTGTITASGQGTVVNLTYVSSSIESYSGGVYRVSLTYANAANDAYHHISLSDRSTHTGSFNAGQPSYVGTGLGVYVWGAQIELGTFASSYVPTTTTSATRAADAVTTTGGLNVILTALPQSTVADVIQNPAGDSIPDARLVSNSADDKAIIYCPHNIQMGTYTGASTLIRSFSSLTFNTGVKVGQCQDASGRTIVGGGGDAAINSDADFGAMSNPARIGSSGISQYFYGYFRRLTVWNSKLPDATLQALTAP